MNKKTRRKVRIVGVQLNIIFHFYKRHKEKLTQLRTWFVARHILDKHGTGQVPTALLVKLVNLEINYFKRIGQHSSLFRHVDINSTYYTSAKKIFQLHKLSKRILLRGEKLTLTFIKLFKSSKKFKGYITKCFAENDLNKKLKNRYTKGRISNQMIADNFKVSRQTIITNLKLSNSKQFKNIISYPWVRFKNESKFGSWLLNNMDKSIGGYKVSNNPKSYFIEYASPNDYYLIQQLPHIYKFTGVYLVSVGAKGAI